MQRPAPELDVLFLCQRVPFPPDRGDRITTHHLLRYFLKRGARVRVGCFSESARDDAAARELAGQVDELFAPRISRRLRKALCLRALCTGQSLSEVFFAHRGLQHRVRKWVQERPPTLTWVYSGPMAQTMLPWNVGLRAMQFAELDSDKWRQIAAQRTGLARWLYRREADRLLAYERRVAQAFDLSFVVSPIERELFESCIPGVRPEVMPNGVDVAHFESTGDGERSPRQLIFTGVMDYEPNVDGVLWFVAECWPAVRGEFPDATLAVVGSSPCPEIQALDGRDGIQVTGRVPETPPWFDRSAVAIAPLRLARGVQNKVLEALSMGLPVVATPQASQGIGTAPGMVVHPDAPALSKAVRDLLRNPERARELGRQAAAHVRSEWQWSSMFDRLDRILAARNVPVSTSSE